MTVRLLCTGDLHFGAGARFIENRLSEQEAHWDRILDLAVERECDAVIVAGDIWHRPRPTPAEYLAFARPIKRHEGLRVLACPGNHDFLAADQPTGLEVLQMPDLAIRSTPGIEALTSQDGETLRIGWLPWTPPHRLVAAQPGVSRDEVDRQVSELLVGQARASCQAGAQMLVAHWSVASARLPGGALVSEFLREPMLSSWDLASLAVPVCLGHIHRHQVIEWGGEERTEPIFYVGSPMPLDFGEGDYEHGVVLLDVAGVTTHEFVELPSRPFVTIDHRDTDAAAAIALAIDSGFDLIIEPGAIVRMRWRATREQQSRIDMPKLTAMLERAGAARVFLLPEIVKTTRARAVVDEDLAPLQAVAAWAEATGVEEPWRGRLLDLTSELLQEVGA